MTSNEQNPPSALAILSEAYRVLDALDRPRGFNMAKSFRTLVNNLHNRTYKDRLQEFSENSLWLSETPHKQINRIYWGLKVLTDSFIESQLHDWIYEDLDTNSNLGKTLQTSLADKQVVPEEFARIISDYGHEKFSAIPETVRLSAQYINNAKIFARTMGITNPSERLLQGLALFEAEGTRAQSLNIGDVKTLQLGMNIKP